MLMAKLSVQRAISACLTDTDGEAMSLRVLGISTSPRVDGNSDLLLKKALEGASDAGADIEYVNLRDFSFAPCRACDACWKTGVCRWQDDYQKLFTRIVDTDRLIFATPIHFMAVCSQGKILIDRCQCLWARKYVLKQPLWPDDDRDRRGMAIAVGGSKSTRMFDAIRMTMHYFFDALQMKYSYNLFINQVDGKGAIVEHPSALSEAFRLGGELISAPEAPPQTVDVELF